MDSIRIVSDEVAENLCSRHEGYFFDRKAAGIDGRGIQRAVVAFANSDGGEVAVGLSEVEQASGRISKWDGAHSPEEYNGLLQAIFDLNPTRQYTEITPLQMTFRY
jgi:ATP-dependent DNA helicase RecG